MGSPARAARIVLGSGAAALVMLGSLASLAARAEAQVLRGRVVTRADGVALGGVVLELQDSSRARVATALSGPAGAFVMRVPQPGAYRVVTRRIGYRSVSAGPFTVAADTTIELAVDAVAQPLPPVTAADLASCRGAGPASDDATIVLWESAQTALMASSVASREGLYEFDVARWRRDYATEPTVLLDVAVDFVRLRDVRPWVSLPPEDIARHGYVRLARDRSLTYVAPDLELLTSDAFASAHCFRVRSDDDPASIGLEFRPVAGGRAADVRGTLWLARATQELTSIDFSFSDIGFQGPDSLAGGRLVFTRLGDGAFIATEWLVRAPVPPDAFVDALLRRAERAERARAPAGRTSPEPIAVGRRDPPWSSNRVVVTGGTVLSLRGAGDTTALWRRGSGEVRVAVRWRRRDRAPAPGVRVTLVGLDISAHTDERGMAHFRDVPPGEYVVATTTEEQEFLHLPRDERLARVHSDAMTDVSLTALPPESAINAVCEHNREDAVIAGVVSQRGRGTINVRLRLETMRRDDAGRMQATPLRTGWSGGAGLYHLCRVPRGASYRVVALFPDGALAIREVTVPSAAAAGESVLIRVDVEVPEP